MRSDNRRGLSLWRGGRLFLLQFLAVSSLFGFFDDSNFGTGTMHFLKLPVGARNLGMGGYAVTIDEGATVTHSNPAGLAGIPFFRYSYSHAEIMWEFRHEYISFVLPASKFGSLGFDANILTSGKIEGADIDGNTGNDFYSTFLALGLSYGAWLIPDRISWGGRADLLQRKIEDVAAVSYGLNLGGSYHLGENMAVGMTLNNLSHGIRNSAPGSPIEAVPWSWVTEIGKRPGLGAWSWNAGIDNNAEGDHILYAGGEWKPLPLFTLRSGYHRSVFPNEQSLVSGVSFGTGLAYHNISLDAGYRMMPPLGGMLAVTVEYSQKSLGKLSPSELLDRARLKMQRKKWGDARKLVIEALAKNPTHWEALILLERIKQEQERLDGNTIILFYTSNTLGEAGQVDVGGAALGGLGRRAEKMNQLRTLYPHSLLLDAGDLTSVASDPGRDSLIHAVYGKLRYDAVNLGPGEMAAGPIRLKAAGEYDGIKWVSTNVSLEGEREAIRDYRSILTERGLRVNILGGVVPSGEGLPSETGFQVKNLLIRIRETRLEFGSPPDLLVLMLYGSLSDAHQVAQAEAGIDVIILSGEEQPFEQPVVSGKTLILCPGTGGSHIGFLSLKYDKDYARRSWFHERVPLDASVPENAAVRSILAPAYGLYPALGGSRLAQKKNPGIFAFIHSNDSLREGSVYLKDMRRNFNYRLTKEGVACSGPVTAHVYQRVAYMCREDDGTRALYMQKFDSPLGIRISGEGEEVLRYRWDPSHYWMYYLADNLTAQELLRTSGIGSPVQRVTSARFSRMSDFDVNPDGRRMAVETDQYGVSQIWITDEGLNIQMRVSDAEFPSRRPRWSPDGKWLAYLRSDRNGQNLELFSLTEEKSFTVTRGNTVQEFSWSENSRQLYFSSGINILDLNVYKLDSMIQKKVTEEQEAGFRNELNPRAFSLEGTSGVLFEARTDSSSSILWVEDKTGHEREMVRLPGYNFLK